MVKFLLLLLLLSVCIRRVPIGIGVLVVVMFPNEFLLKLI